MSVQPDYACTAPSLAHAVEAVDPPIPMLILERGLRIRWVSSAAVKELGVRADRLIGRTWYDLFPESRARAAEHDQLFAGARASLEVPRIALELDCGRPKYFSLRLRPIRAADGSVEAILGLGEDITAQVLAELALRDNEERFQAISTHANDLIVIVNRGGVISFASASLETVLGRRPNDRVGGSIFDHLHPEDLPRAQLAFRRLVDDPSATTPGGDRAAQAAGGRLLALAAIHGHQSARAPAGSRHRVHRPRCHGAQGGRACAHAGASAP
jgi:PAS domain S-box-containing protein